jgi:hypothetical protein
LSKELQMRGIFITAALAGATVLAAPASAQQDTGKRFSVALEGEQVTFGGDLDGTGTASIRINAGRGEICYTLRVRNIETATLAHIHEGQEGENGPVVVDFVPPASGSSSGCVIVGRALAMEIIRDPSDYYVVVHNDEFPAGALRGQLGR